MAWTPTDPEMRDVPGPKISKAITFRVYDLHVIDEAPACTLSLREGYTEGDPPVFIETARKHIQVPDAKYPGGGVAELAAAMLGPVDPTLNRRDNVRDGVYEMLVALGEIPAGAAS